MNPPQDEAARVKLRQQLEYNVMCLAGAGAGKTHELVERMVASIGQGICQVDELAAITFTRKAAGELRGRFSARLQEAATLGTAQEQARLQQAVRHLDQCTIGTIHAFCAQLLRQYPLQAGLSADFQEVEEREELWLARSAWDHFLESRSAAGDGRLLAIEETGLTAEQFYQFFLTRCQHSDLPLKPTSEACPDLQSAIKQLQQFIEEVAAQIPTTLPGEPDRLMTAISQLRHRFSVAAPQADAERAYVLRSFDSSAATQVTLKRWGPPGSPEQNLARRLRDDLVPALRTQIIQPPLASWRRYVYTLAAGFVDEAMDFYRHRRRQQSLLTFNDLMESATALLRDHPDTRRALQEKYRVIFVDEFQDTDPLQAQILLYLTGAEVSQPTWQTQTPQPGRLFLVGDEKQSIYRFRRADVDVFRHMRQRLEAGGGQVIELTTTFRARPNLARWYNDTFEGLFEAQDLRFQADFARLQAHRIQTSGAGVYRLRCDPQRQTRQQRVEDEAQKIARFIAAAIAGQTALNGEDAVLGSRARPGDFMILTRTRRWLSHYGRALEAQGIVYDITGAGSLRTSVELRALVQALECLLQPHDSVAWVAMLRGLLVGLGDDELFALRQAGYRFRTDATVPDGLDAILAERLTATIELLVTLGHDLARGPMAAALERFVDTTGLAAMAAGREGGSARAGNLLRVLALVRDWQARRGLSWARIASELRDLLDGDEFRIEEMTLEAGRQDVVRVMNLHQAKGLEAKVVFLVDPTDTSAEHHGVNVHVSRLGDQPYLSMAVTARGARKPWVMAEPVGWEKDAKLEARYLAAEQLRLVYVAATRAADVLVVGQGPTHSGTWKDLQHGLRDVEDLPLPQDLPPVVDREDETVVDLIAPRQRREQRWMQLRQPSWEQVTITDAEDGWHISTQRIESGHGRHYGRVLHRLLEYCATGRLAPDDEEAVAAVTRSLLAAQGSSDLSLLEDACLAVARWRASEIWEELATSDEVHVEVPYAAGQAGRIERGVIDLVYRVGDGWRLVDYKTQALAGEDDAERERSMVAMLDRYRRQLTSYADHWRDAAGDEKVRAGLWLTDCGLWLPLDQVGNTD
ncbi:MAG: UvrD-helicase domain-containing protein [Gemmatimonadetes bacterium]|nr:UvrD-helicase domain-containing protein [Gemmatimonadota bacterium]MBT7863302.1 UvrD-helicase domain-containing protein [Gemmatimonadota bacterium]